MYNIKAAVLIHIEDKPMKTKIRTILIFAMMLALAFTYTFSYADDESMELVVKDSRAGHEQNVTLTQPQLEEVAAAEGNKSYNYAGRNHYYSVHTYSAQKGPTVKGLLEKASIDTDTLEDNTVIKIVGSQGFTKRITWKQLTESRYYFPNLSAGTAKGNYGTSESRSGAVKVPAIIALNNHSKFCVGQLRPNEKNIPMYVDEVAAGEPTGIEILSEAPKTCAAITQSSPAAGTVYIGTKVDFIDPEPKVQNQVLYCVDSSDFLNKGIVYNYNNYYVTDILTNGPVLNKLGKHYIKVRSEEFGRKASAVKTFNYTVIDIKNVTSVSLSRVTKNKVKATWKAAGGAKGYTVYYKRAGTSTWSKYSTTKRTFTKVLKHKKKYYYKVRAYKTINGKKHYSPKYSKTNSITTK